MLYSVVLTFESVDEISRCDQSNESYGAVLSSGVVCFSIFCKIKFGFSPVSTELTPTLKKVNSFGYKLTPRVMSFNHTCSLLHSGQDMGRLKLNIFRRIPDAQTSRIFVSRKYCQKTLRC